MRLYIQAMTPNLYRAQLHLLLNDLGVKDHDTGIEGETKAVDIPGSTSIMAFGRFIKGRFKVRQSKIDNRWYLIPNLNNPELKLYRRQAS